MQTGEQYRSTIMVNNTQLMDVSMNLTGSGNFSSNQTIGGGPPRGGPPRGFPGGLAEAKIALNMIKYGYAVLTAAFIIGLILAFITLSRRKIRSYSSAVYLIAIFCFDFCYMLGSMESRWIRKLMDSPVMSDSLCSLQLAVNWLGWIGGGALIAVLATERVLVLSKPNGFHGLTNPRLAGVIVGVVLVCCLAYSSFDASVGVYDPRRQECSYDLKKVEKIGVKPFQVGTGILCFFLLCQLIAIIMLGRLIYLKRKQKKSDPVNSSLASARSQLNQLNRINLIVFIFSLQNFFTNVPLMLGPGLFFTSRRLGKITYGQLLLNVGVINFVAYSLVASRFFVVLAASPKIRQETWKALRCIGSTPQKKKIDVRPDKVKQKFEKANALEANTSTQTQSRAAHPTELA